jgi:anti-sigma regulatory factor (Ser/Thr protein kinase)
MKKIYKSERFRCFNKRRSLRAEKKRRKRKNKKKFYRNLLYKKSITKNKEKTIYAPEIFSLVNNTEEFMKFLKEFDSHAWHGNSIFIDLAEIKNITPDALLCIIAYLARYKTLSNVPEIKGNIPDDLYCNQTFRESGFFKYVISNLSHKDTENILSIKNGNIIDPEEAASVVKFVRGKLKIEELSITRAVYATIMEAMNNVSEHAYGTKKDQGWWLMALPEKDSDIIHFSLVDNGKGIPVTVRKKMTERIISNDGSLIRAAVLENRSETGIYYRGNGLPKLKKLVDNKMIKNLHIISRKGYYYVDEDKVYTLPHKYRGTIIFWDFIKRLT